MMLGPLDIEAVHELGAWFDPFVQDAASEGFHFIDRLAREWRTGENRFAGAGERLIVARVTGVASGLCGLNRDAAARDAGAGRLRHLYVRPIWRRRGIGRTLVEELLRSARLDFTCVRLRTDSPAAEQFYRCLGFVPCAQPGATHVMTWPSGR